MSKGIAIRTILLLLVGILIAGILIYFVYSYTTGSASLSTTDCLSKVTSWCTSCMVSNWANGFNTINSGDDIETCIDSYFGTGWEATGGDCYDEGGGGTDRTKDFCSDFVS